MATPVPYQPVPTVGPSEQPLQRVQVATPLAAFGGDTAQAIQHLGQVSSQAGNELFTRAVALQQFDQTAQANAAISNFTTQMGQKFAAYTSLQGKAAADGYQPFISDVNQTRETMRNQLQSPFAQRAFDQETRFLQARVAMSGAFHAGDQLKVYGNQSSDSVIKSNQMMAGVNPTDNASFSTLLNNNLGQIDHQAAINNWDPATITLKKQMETSTMWSQRIQAVADTQPNLAGNMLKEAHQSGALVGDDFSKMIAYVQRQQNTIGARIIANKAISGGDLSWGDKILPPTTARAAIKGNESGGNYTIQGPEVTNKEGVSGRALGAYQIMDYNLQPWLKEAGMPSMTPQQFLADPSAQDKLFDFKFGQYQQQYGSWNKAASAWFTGNPNAPANASDGYHTAAWYLTNGNQWLAQHASLSDINANVTDQAKAYAPDNPNLPQYAINYAEMVKGKQLQAIKYNDYMNKQTIESGLVKAVGPDGKLPSSLEELEQDPKWKQAYQSAQPQVQQAVLKQLSANAKNGDYMPTDANQAQFHQLLGQLTDPTMSEAERDKALDTNIAELPMPASQRQMLMNARTQLFNHMEANPNVQRAMSQIADMTNGVLDKNSSPDDYYRFYGEFQETIKDQMEQTKEPLKLDQVRSIAQNLLKQVSSGGWFSSPTLGYQTSVPDDFKTRAVKIARVNGQQDPTEAQIRDAYFALQYRALTQKRSNGRPQQ